MTELTDRVVLITGAARGIGSAIARALAGAGAHVVLHDLDAEGPVRKLTDELGDRALSLGADLTDPRSTPGLWRDAVQWKGRVDVLVNNAGVYEPAPDEGELTPGSRPGSGR
jgi:3-oxoacyl-[acyl-carrier protein] reductase